MVDADVCRASRIARGLAALAVACLAGCAGADTGGSMFVVHDKYTPYTCEEIVRMRTPIAEREQELTALSRKAEAAAGGAMVNAVAYATELANARSELRAADFAARQKGCPPMR